MRLRKVTVVLLVLVSFLCGRGVINPLAAFPHTIYVYHGVEVENHAMGEGIPESIEFWKREASRRFANPLLIVGHGNDYRGVWCMYQQVEHRIIPLKDVAEDASRRHPGRTIVLICCNPQGHSLGVPGVYHARDSVWFVPDKDANNTEPERQAERNIVGNIWEFDDQ